MNKTYYIEESLSYIKGEQSLENLISKFKPKLKLSVSGANLLPKKRFILISNHPLTNPELFIPTKQIKNIRGGNKYGYNFFHFSVVQYILFQELLGSNFYVIANDIGWQEVLEEMSFIVVNPVNEVIKTRNIIVKAKKINGNLIIFPEGGAKNQEVFQSGFLYIAKKLNISHLVVAIMSPIPSLFKENFLKIIAIINIKKTRLKPTELTEKLRIFIIESLKKKIFL